MDLFEMSFVCPEQMCDAADIYLRRYGACGVAAEDPSELARLLKRQEAGTATPDESIFLDPEYLAEKKNQAQIKAWFSQEGDRVYLLEEALDLFDLPEDFFEDEVDEADAQGDAERLEDTLLGHSLYPVAGGQKRVQERHTLDAAKKILTRVVEELFDCFEGSADEKECAKSSLHFQTIEEKDWIEAYKAHYDVLELTPHFLICPSWRKAKPEDGQKVIHLDPGAAFGTGMHATTALCATLIEALKEEQNVQPRRVLDLGTGSGILAIVAAFLFDQLPPESIEAIDIDQNAIKIARDNFARNGVTPIQAKVASIEAASGPYDLLLANLIADLHLRFAKDYVLQLADKGYAVFSGIIDERCEEVRETLEASGLKILKDIHRDGWTAFLAQKEK